jgi:hypothetical protein
MENFISNVLTDYCERNEDFRRYGVVIRRTLELISIILVGGCAFVWATELEKRPLWLLLIVVGIMNIGLLLLAWHNTMRYLLLGYILDIERWLREFVSTCFTDKILSDNAKGQNIPRFLLN